MCCNETGPSLKLVFKEISRTHKPTLCTNNANDLNTLGKVLSLVNNYCLSLDGCASSRVCTDIQFFEQLVATPCFPPNTPLSALKKYFTCPIDETSCNCESC